MSVSVILLPCLLFSSFIWLTVSRRLTPNVSPVLLKVSSCLRGIFPAIVACLGVIFLDFSEATRENFVCNRRCINKVKLDLIYNRFLLLSLLPMLLPLLLLMMMIIIILIVVLVVVLVVVIGAVQMTWTLFFI